MCCVNANGLSYYRMLKLADFPFYTTFFSFFYVGIATAAACLQRRRIHTRML
jgi:hypothetical protein